MKPKTSRRIRIAVFTILGIGVCWFVIAVWMESPMIDRGRLRQSLDAGLVGDCTKLVAAIKESLTFLPRTAWPSSIKLLRPERVLVDSSGVLIVVWSCSDTWFDVFHQSSDIQVSLADEPPCFPGNPPGLEHCEKVADRVYFRYSPAVLKDGKVSLFSRLRAHCQHGRFKD